MSAVTAPARRGGTLLTRTECRLVARSPATAFWGLLVPVAGVVAVGLIPGTRDPDRDLGGATFLASYVPVLLVFSLTMLALNALPATLADYRSRGVLRRLALTPAGPLRVLAVQGWIHLELALVAAVLIVALPAVAFGVGWPGAPLALVVAWALSAAALLAMGLTVAALAPTGKAASAAGGVLFFPLLFFAGLWVPRASMSDTLRHVSDFTPSGAAAQALQDAAAGSWPGALHLVVLAGWAVVLGTVAVRTFRW